MHLKNQAQDIPVKPGVYFFKNRHKKIIYIGKAKNLKNRVKSYFNKNNKSIKTQVMISKASFLDYLIVSDEVEAIITESNMIKEYKPIPNNIKTFLLVEIIYNKIY